MTTIDAFVEELKHQVPGARITASGAPLLIASDLEIAPQPAWLAGLPKTGVADGIGAHARTLCKRV
ncbi:hypothetical protein [Allomesorhizobium camelthorni]|uniref:Uncharacterized protein n=1 Tax=Allomesorhizobium camelthorni TaxID=475069 RepID=A0A6G4WEP9_9HYPH|nr:hypothetical protein [Mesorhizobium camelthorni]NGO53064.1 hypothetical protein [Mesorhizobium camelthorni]